MRSILRQIVAVLALVGITTSMVPATFAVTYTAQAAADKLAASGFIVDQSANPAAYRLADNLLRQEAVGTAANVLGILTTPLSSYVCQNKFSDVKASSGWVCRAAELAADAGLTNAANATFRPKDNLTRYEALVFALRAAGLVPTGSQTQAGLIQLGVDNGLITSAAGFNASAAATRGEFFQYVVRGLDAAETPELCDILGICPTNPPVIVPGTGGAVTASAGASAFAAGTTLPVASGITVGKINLSAGSKDVVVSALRLWHRGVGARTDIASVGLFANGAKVAKSKAISSEDSVDLNMISPLVISAGTTVTLDVVVSTNSNAGEHYFQLGATDITSNASGVNGSFPVSTPLFKTSTTSAGTLTFSTDGSLADVKLGQTGAVLAKFKVATSSVEDITIKSMTFKKDAVSTSQDSDFTNFKLFLNGSQVSSGTLVNKYVTFPMNTTILKNKSDQKFEIRADVIGGASKTIKLVIDSSTDITANGSQYLYGANTSGTGSAPATTVNITAGAVSLVREDATIDKVIANKKDVVFGKIKVTANSGKDVELSTLKFTIDTTLDSAVGASTAFGEIENLEVYNETTNQIYDLSYVSGTSSKIYSNTDMGLILRSGVTNSLVVRADTKVAAVDGDYTVKIANATGGDVVMKEVANDTTVTDITPNAISLKKVSVATAAFTMTQNALSSALNAVIGTTGIELINFNMKANDVGDLKIKELKFADEAAGTLDNTLVSGFKLWKIVNGSPVLVKEVGTSDLASQELTVRDLNEVIPANTTVRYALTTSLVKDTNEVGQTIKVRVSGYSVENADGNAAYTGGTGVDSNSDGIITAAQAGAVSARTVTAVGTGSFSNIAVDTLDSAVSKNKNVLANTTSDFIAAFKLSASNEGISVEDMDLIFSSDVSGSVDTLILYRGDKVTEIAREAVTGATVQFRNIPNFKVAEGTESVYAKIVTRKIGKNEAGSIALNKTLRLTVVSATGASSGDDISGLTTAHEGTTTVTAVSKTFSVVPVRVSNVAFVNSNGGENVVGTNSLSSGVSQIIGIVAVTADTTTNTNSSGAILKTALTNLEYSIAGTATYAGIKITRIGGADTNGQASNAPTGAASYFDMSALTGGDNLIEGGQTAYFKIEATPTVAAGLSIQLSLPNLDSSTANEGIDYDSDAGSHTVNILNIGQTTVTGPTLSRPN